MAGHRLDALEGGGGVSVFLPDAFSGADDLLPRRDSVTRQRPAELEGTGRGMTGTPIPPDHGKAYGSGSFRDGRLTGRHCKIHRCFCVPCRMGCAEGLGRIAGCRHLCYSTDAVLVLGVGSGTRAGDGTGGLGQGCTRRGGGGGV